MQSNYLACVLLLAAAGCEKDDPLFCKENPGATGCPRADGDVDDAVVDMMTPVDGRACFGGGTYPICLTTSPSGQVVFNPGDFDTSATNTLCLATQPADWMAAGQPDACIIVGETIVVPTLNIIGTRPLVLLASTTITLNGLLDVSSRRSPSSKLGPGSPSPNCGAYSDIPADTSSGGGGGAGGSFITTGGDGGEGNGAGGSGGAALLNIPSPPSVLRAGCPGQKGGAGDSADNGGLPGPGGGAVVLLAGTSIVFNNNSIINASGAGASKANDSSGGGGGGSGGMIVLNAPMITIGSGVALLANGGGGSSGGNDTGGCGCNAGSDPNPLDALSNAPGGSGGGGAGGTGFAEGAPAVDGSNAGSNLGGGGGGGGAGFIQASVVLTGATVSPVPIIL